MMYSNLKEKPYSYNEFCWWYGFTKSNSYLSNLVCIETPAVDTYVVMNVL